MLQVFPVSFFSFRMLLQGELGDFVMFFFVSLVNLYEEKF